MREFWVNESGRFVMRGMSISVSELGKGIAPPGPILGAELGPGP